MPSANAAPVFCGCNGLRDLILETGFAFENVRRALWENASGISPASMAMRAVEDMTEPI